jgi:hypothetical protein
VSAIEELKIDVPAIGRVSGILQMPDDAVALYVLGHGTGSDMAYSVISGLATELSARGVATLRFHYPYSDHPDYVAQSGMATDTLDVMMAVMRAVVLRAGTLAPDLPVFAGGHSMSAEVASNAESIAALQARGLFCWAIRCVMRACRICLGLMCRCWWCRGRKIILARSPI